MGQKLDTLHIEEGAWVVPQVSSRHSSGYPADLLAPSFLLFDAISIIHGSNYYEEHNWCRLKVNAVLKSGRLFYGSSGKRTKLNFVTAKILCYKKASFGVLKY